MLFLANNLFLKNHIKKKTAIKDRKIINGIYSELQQTIAQLMWDIITIIHVFLRISLKNIYIRCLLILLLEILIKILLKIL